MMFIDREDAGVRLSQKLQAYKNGKDTIVLGLARGGVIVAKALAHELSLPVNALVPRKIGAPGNPELAIGAVSEDGEIFLKESIVKLVGATPSYIRETAKKEQEIAKVRLSMYRKKVPLPDLTGKTVILVDDGVATGSTIMVEIQALRKKALAKLILAVPVAATDTWKDLQKKADEAVCLSIEEDFFGVSQFYQDFSEVNDEMVIAALTTTRPS